MARIGPKGGWNEPDVFSLAVSTQEPPIDRNTYATAQSAESMQSVERARSSAVEPSPESATACPSPALAAASDAVSLACSLQPFSERTKT